MKCNSVIPYKAVFFPFIEYIAICICIYSCILFFGGDFKNSSQTNCDILHIFLAVQNLCQNKNNHHFVVFNKATVVYISTSPCF